MVFLPGLVVSVLAHRWFDAGADRHATLCWSGGRRRGRQRLLVAGMISQLIWLLGGGGLRGQGCGADLRHALQPGHYLRSEEHKSELQSLMRISFAVFCLKKKKKTTWKQPN